MVRFFAPIIPLKPPASTQDPLLMSMNAGHANKESSNALSHNWVASFFKQRNFTMLDTSYETAGPFNAGITIFGENPPLLDFNTAIRTASGDKA